MKKFILLSALLYISCQGPERYCLSPEEVKIETSIALEINDKIHEELQADGFFITSSREMPCPTLSITEKYKTIIYPYREIDDVRRVITKVVDKYLIAYNNSRAIRPYLCCYPVTADNLHISIYFYDKNQDTLPAPYFSQVECKFGTINYYMLDDDEVPRLVESECFE